METQQLKAKFCQQYFNTILTFVNRCNVMDNDFGLQFLYDSLPAEARHDNYSWHLKGDDYVEEKELMLGIEEFWALTDERCRGERELLIGVLLGKKYKLQDIANVSVALLIKIILTHFGDFGFDELPEISPAVGRFAKCLDLLKSVNAISFLEETDKMHRFCTFIVYSLIGLTVLLRRAWQNDIDGQIARKYTAPKHFEMPEQKVEVHIRLEDPGLAEPLNFICEGLNYAIIAKKYEPFNIDLNFGKEKFLKRGIHFTSMLTYYSWQTVVDVMIPKNYETNPLQIQLREKQSCSGQK